MAENIVNTYNLFVDTSRGHSANSKGDDFELNFGHTDVVADEGQYIRLSLNNFSMHKVFADVNATNKTFKMRVANSGATGTVTLTERNNTTLNALATDFANNVGAYIVGQDGNAGSFTISNLLPSSTTSIGGDSNYIISFRLTFNTALETDTQPNIIFALEDGDVNELLGGDRREGDLTNALSSISVSRATDRTYVDVECLYPAQRQTIDHLFLRAVGTQNTSVETLGFLNPNETHKADVTDSDILAKIPVDVEYCSYEAQTGREYFLNIRQKVLTNLRLRLTDRHNRLIGRAFGSSKNTATGNGDNQSTLGNLSFNAVIRVDIVQQRHPRHLETPAIPERTAARFENLLIQPKFGKSEY